MYPELVHSVSRHHKRIQEKFTLKFPRLLFLHAVKLIWFSKFSQPLISFSWLFCEAMDGKTRVLFLHKAIYVDCTVIAKPTDDEVTNVSSKNLLVLDFILL
jgi:hypothetical protein